MMNVWIKFSCPRASTVRVECKMINSKKQHFIIIYSSRKEKNCTYEINTKQVYDFIIPLVGSLTEETLYGTET